MSNLSILINEVLARLMNLEIELLSGSELEPSMMEFMEKEIIPYLQEFTFELVKLVTTTKR